MNANELRIGNLIYWDIPEKENVPHEVIGIKQGKPLTTPISLGDTMDEYKPIPLTEEWLLRFGFTRHLSSLLYLKPLNSLKNLVIYLDKDDHVVAFADYYTGREKTEVFPNRIKYVHQLQNLYFALTETDLV